MARHSDQKMAELKAKFSPPADMGEANGLCFKGNDGQLYTGAHIAGVARRELVPLGVPAVPALIKYLDDDDSKICCVAAMALDGITNVYAGGMVMNDMYDVKSPGHARLVAAFQEWWARATGKYAQPDLGFDYSCRRAKEGMKKSSLWVEQRHQPFLLSDGKVGILSGAKDVSVAIFDPATESISYREAPVKKGWLPPVIPLPQDQVLMLNNDTCTIYDFGSNASRGLAGEFPLRKNFERASTVLPDGRVFFCGGSIDRQPVSGCWLFEPKSSSFSRAGELAVPRSGHQATLLSDGKVLVSGGKPEDFRAPCLDSIEVFDLETGKSRLLDAKLSVRRSAHGAIRLRDGKVLIAGGFDVTQRPSELHAAEVFDPALGQSVKVDPMALGRSTVYMSLLPSGRVAVFGGVENARVIEIYCPGEQKFIMADQLMLDRRKWIEGQPVALRSGEVLVVGGRPNSTNEVLTSIEFLRETHVEKRPGHAQKPGVPAPGKPLRWCIELQKRDGSLEKLFLAKYPAKEEREGLSSLLKPDVTQIIVRFPSLYLYEQQGRNLDWVGGTSFPNVFLGAPLQGDE
ncbi:MAG: hypothetical protein NTW87_01275 [Planctomycetota bacterium]|nr:hypothetical protein [Planctomycetota bacterium]